MKFKQMARLEPGLTNLERRMQAVKDFICGYYNADEDDIEIINLGAFDGLPAREYLCLSRSESNFNQTLILLVGPNGMHPSLKDPEFYSIAHNHLWRNFPTCGKECPCSRIPSPT